MKYRLPYRYRPIVSDYFFPLPKFIYCHQSDEQNWAYIIFLSSCAGYFDLYFFMQLDFHSHICITFVFVFTPLLRIKGPSAQLAHSIDHPLFPLPSDICAPCRAELQSLYWGHTAAPCPVCGGAGGELWWSRRLWWAAHHRHPLHERFDQAGWSHSGQEVGLSFNWRNS